MLGGYNTYLEALGSQVSGLTTSGRIILSFTPNGNSRSRIYVSNKTNVLFILDLYPRDVTMVKITYISESRRNLLSRQHTFNMT
jgi:adenylate kinase family enzyme